jgi:formate hydrogenlyase subunit 3/multisubunit Na+/H+ antiporter MnhD subunit
LTVGDQERRFALGLFLPAFVLLLLMFSMAGVPPTVGFYAKLAVLQPVITAGYIWLAAVAVMLAGSTPRCWTKPVTSKSHRAGPRW